MAPALITGFHEFYEIYKHLGTKRVEDGVVLQSYPQRTFNVAAIHGVLNALTGEFFFVPFQAFCSTLFVSLCFLVFDVLTC
jgi:spore maturation protein CgeB